MKRRRDGTMDRQKEETGLGFEDLIFGLSSLANSLILTSVSRKCIGKEHKRSVVALTPIFPL